MTRLLASNITKGLQIRNLKKLGHTNSGAEIIYALTVHLKRIVSLFSCPATFGISGERLGQFLKENFPILKRRDLNIGVILTKNTSLALRDG
jgi:hypothetical protein